MRHVVLESDFSHNKNYLINGVIFRYTEYDGVGAIRTVDGSNVTYFLDKTLRTRKEGDFRYRAVNIAGNFCFWVYPHNINKIISK
jgi:hypothetical protein